MNVSRAPTLQGPWKTRASIDDTTGGHQGAIVDLPDGTDYGFVMVDSTGVGRLTNISPITWADGWPYWGVPGALDQVPAKAEKPIKGMEPSMPATSDDFSSPTLGLQWQWNHNPLPEKWSLTERPGWLRLHATDATDFWTARNTLTQKSWGPYTRAAAKLDISNLREGDQCGLGTLGKYNGHVVVNGGPGGRHTLSMRLITDQGDDTPQDTTIMEEGVDAHAQHLYLRVDLDLEADEGRLAYSFDAADWQSIGEVFPLAFDWRTGTFQGEQIALFCYGSEGTRGYLDVDEVQLSGRPMTE